MIIGIEAQRIFRRQKHGMDFVVLETIIALQKLDTVNQYYVFVGEGDDQCLTETPNFKIIRLSGSYPVFEQFKLPRKARKLGCELLHLTSNTGPVRCSTPTLLTLHDIIYYERDVLFRQGYSNYQRLGNIYRQLVVKRVANRAVKILTVSNSEKKKIIKALKLSPDKIKTIYNGVGQHFLNRPSDSEINRIKYKYDLPKSYLLFLGNTDPKKNTHNTILAFARFCEQTAHKHKLVVADYPEKNLLRTLESEGLEKYFSRFKTIGYINNQDLPQAMAGAEAFLYPSIRESFGIPILEAMGVGTPVITSNSSSMPEVGGEAVILIDPSNPDAIAAAINKLIEDDTLKDELVVKGFERVKKFTWKEAARQVLAVYQTAK